MEFTARVLLYAFCLYALILLSCRLTQKPTIMETYKNESVSTDQHLFELQIDQQSISYLSETAKWAKFLSIMGFIGCGLMLIFALFAGTLMATFSQMGSYSAGNAMGGAALSLIYLAIALLYFFPCLYLFKFANKMQFAVRNNDQTTLNTSLRNLKGLFKFLGILTIVIMSVYVLAIVIGIAAAAFIR